MLKVELKGCADEVDVWDQDNSQVNNCRMAFIGTGKVKGGVALGQNEIKSGFWTD